MMKVTLKVDEEWLARALKMARQYHKRGPDDGAGGKRPRDGWLIEAYDVQHCKPLRCNARFKIWGDGDTITVRQID